MPIQPGRLSPTIAALGLVLATTARPDDVPRLEATVSWMGNDDPGAAGWVQQDIKTIFVAADGSVFTNVFWDEGGGQVALYRDGRQLARAGRTHGWGQEGGEAIAANDRYVFIGQEMNNEGGGLKDPSTWPPKGKTWFGLSRRLRSDITRPAPFAGGKGGKGDTLKGCFLVVYEAAGKARGDLSGLAADARRVYASSPAEDRIRVYDAETVEPAANWPVERPGPLAMAADGGLWVLQKGDGRSPARVLRLGPDGARLRQAISFDAGVVPTAIAVDGRGRMLVADDGPDQRILIYEEIDRDPRPAGTFGEKGGIYSGTPGVLGPRKFNRPTGVGVDAAGNLYVACDGQSDGGGAVLECYRPDGSLVWRRLGLEFVDMADVDPGDDADIFTKEEHFRADYARPRGRETAYAGYTIHRSKYPEDPRLHLGSAGAWVRRIEGRRFLFVNEMYAGHLQVYRFDPAREGEIAVPSGLIARSRLKGRRDAAWPPHQPSRGEWIWRDADGDGRFDADEYQTRGGKDGPATPGWWVDDAGNIWQADEADGLRMLPIRGLDANGNPTWDLAAMKVFPRPSGFDRVRRLRYDPSSDVLYVGGTAGEHTHQHWKPMGPVIARYDHWSRGESPPRWRVVAPYARGSRGHESCEPIGFDVAGDYLFVPYTGASKAIGYATGHVEVLRADDGRRIGFLEPSADVGEIGLQDIPECLCAHRRDDGEYLVFLEEDAKAKILMYRWKPRPGPVTP